MRLFASTSTSLATPRSSPELVRHSQVPHAIANVNDDDHGYHSNNGNGIVSTLGRKLSRRFGDSEAGRKFRMASPARKYHWSVGEEEKNPQNKKRISRVDSFRNFFSLATSTVAASTNTLRTPRAVKRRSRNAEKRDQRQQRHQQSGSFVDVGVGCSNVNNSFSSLPTFDLALSECQSEADLRYYSYQTDPEDEDERSVVSDGYGLKSKASSRSAGNLVSNAVRLGILPENHTINFGNDNNNYRMKNYGMIDKAASSPRKTSTSHESGYSSDSPNSSSRASPRGAFNDTDPETDSGSGDAPKQQNLPKPLPPKKPIRVSKLANKDFKMIRVRKSPPQVELGIIIAKKKLRHIETTGFHIVHIEPGGLIDL